ncbi:MAG TPA: hypothetical protein VK952_01255 [Methylotenera sp.]|nr:hypothetical protein [Methylotenera sp.]
MNDEKNKTSIWSVVALDIIDYSKKTGAEQLEAKKLLDGFIHHAVIDIAQDDRLIVDSVSGAVIICSGPLEDALEDALFISITIRDEILNNNMHGATPLYVQFGIHLGAARVVKNSTVGEGVDEARRIMSFAKPNQILVSNVYFEMASKLTQEMAQMFEKYEMHAHEHDVYSVRLLKDAVAEEPLIPAADHVTATKWQSITAQANWTYIALSLLVLVAFFALAKSVVPPVEPIITVEQPVVAEPSAETELTVEPNQANTKQNEVKAAKVVQKKSKQEAAVNAEATTSKPENSAENTGAKPAQSKAGKGESKVESTWESLKDSVKQGTKRECTQAEIAMNQCAK